MNKTYHITIKKPEGNQRTADQYAARLVEDKAKDIEAAGGSISLSRTFDTSVSMAVVVLPDAVDIRTFFTEGVKEYMDAAPVGDASADEPGQ